jgi:ribosome biogenesis protein ERB1
LFLISQMPDRNTVGDVPLEWYKDEEHIGYDTAGKKLKKKECRDQLDSFLARTDDANDWYVTHVAYSSIYSHVCCEF